MKRAYALFVLLSVFVVLAFSGAAHATNGLYPFAFSGKSAGMGGATLASGDDALNQVINPANLPDIPRRIDFDVMWIRANVNFQNRGPNQLINNLDGTTPFYSNDKNGAVDPCCTTDNNFNIPVVGYVHPLNPMVTLGLAAYGLAGGGGRIKGIDGPLYQDSKYRAMMLIAAGGPSIGIKLGDSVNLGFSVVGIGGKLGIQQPAGFNPSTYALGTHNNQGGCDPGTPCLPFGIHNFAEFFKDIRVYEGVGYVKFKDDAGVSARGVGVKLGLTVKPAKWLRISAAFTPRRALRFSGTAQFDFNRQLDEAFDFMAITPGTATYGSFPGENACATPGTLAIGGDVGLNVCQRARDFAKDSAFGLANSLASHFTANVPSGGSPGDPGTTIPPTDTVGLAIFREAIDPFLVAFGFDPSKGWVTDYHTTASLVLPPQADVGIAIMPTDDLTLEVDASYYWYKRSWRRFGFDLSEGTNPNINNILGTDTFTYAFRVGWKDMVTYRAGIQYALNKAVTLRAGYAYGTNPIAPAGASILFPAYGFHTATVGGTWRFWERYEITAALERAFERSLSTTKSNIECFQGAGDGVINDSRACPSHGGSTESHNQFTGHFQLSYIFR